MPVPVAALKPGDLALIGLCTDDHSSHMRGPAAAPPAIRAALFSGASNLTTELGVDLADHPRFIDLGDRDVAPAEEALLGIEDLIAPILAQGARPLVLGGDHAVTYSVLRAVAARHAPVDILHFDAHPDLYDALTEVSRSGFWRDCFPTRPPDVRGHLGSAFG